METVMSGCQIPFQLYLRDAPPHPGPAYKVAFSEHICATESHFSSPVLNVHILGWLKAVALAYNFALLILLAFGRLPISTLDHQGKLGGASTSRVALKTGFRFSKNALMPSFESL